MSKIYQKLNINNNKEISYSSSNYQKISIDQRITNRQTKKNAY